MRPPLVPIRRTRSFRWGTVDILTCGHFLPQWKNSGILHRRCPKCMRGAPPDARGLS